MLGHLIWVCHGLTSNAREACFPDDEPLEDDQYPDIAHFQDILRHRGRIISSPALRARQTAERLEHPFDVEPRLAECDYSRWKCQRLADVAQSDPQGLAGWMKDMAAVPHGGEALSQLFKRTADWMNENVAVSGQTLVVSHASIIRAAILTVLGAPSEAFWTIDVEPLSFTEMTTDGRRWHLRMPRRHKA